MAQRRLGPYNIQDDATVCNMMVVVDNELYHYWKRDSKLVAKSATQIIDGANRIYRDKGPLIRSASDASGTPIQFHLKQLFVATDDFCFGSNWTDVTCSAHSDASKLLWSIRMSADFNHFCLGLYMTGSSLNNREGKVLGMAPIGGTCCSRAEFAWRPVSPNVAMLAAREIGDVRQAGYILAHELGHSLGAQHDDKSAANLLMAPGHAERNLNESANQAFSHKTMGAIHRQLVKNLLGDVRDDSLCLKRSWCFTEPSTNGSQALDLEVTANNANTSTDYYANTNTAAATTITTYTNTYNNENKNEKTINNRNTTTTTTNNNNNKNTIDNSSSTTTTTTTTTNVYNNNNNNNNNNKSTITTNVNDYNSISKTTTATPTSEAVKMTATSNDDNIKSEVPYEVVKIISIAVACIAIIVTALVLALILKCLTTKRPVTDSSSTTLKTFNNTSC